MTNTITIRQPTGQDGGPIWSLVKACAPLDLNSQYAYMMLGHYFKTTCAVAEADGEIIAFTSGFRPPEQQDTLFVWQVAVHPEQRKKGLAQKMVRTILDQGGLRFIEATVGPSNTASHNLFLSLARDFNAPFKESVLFKGDSFPEGQHEDEILIRIGPIDSKGDQ